MDFRKILVAVDASENAIRAVEYTANILGNCHGQFRVEVLTIERLPERDLFPSENSWMKGCENARAEMQKFLGRAREILEKGGVEPEIISERYITSCRSPFQDDVPVCSMGTSVAQEILEFVRDGGFGTVVVGRRGVSKAEEFLFGSVSNKIIHSVKDCTVWVVA